MADDHFKVRDIPGYQANTIDKQFNQQQPPRFPIQQDAPKHLRYTNLLWVFASTMLVLLNILSGVMSIRDMYLTNYNPYNHYFMTSAFALTIGILAIVHTYILKKE